VVLIYGSQPQSALILVAYAAFWQVLVQVLYGVADVDPVVRDTARSYRFSRWAVVRTVVWPTAMPYVVTGFRLAAAVALILEITAELIIGVQGLGRAIGVAVVLRGSSPLIATGARQALSIGVILMVISELFGANRGLGAAIVQFQRGFAIAQMWTGIVLLGLLGVALSGLFRLVEHRSLAWYRGLRQAERGA
jgi:ABC-type nitrate/sulfonate/bicarbonate transport system permease component